MQIMAVRLTPHQDKTLRQLDKLSKSFPVLILQGDKDTGKHTIIQKFLNLDQKSSVVCLDLCSLSLTGKNKLTAGKFYKQLIALKEYEYLDDIINPRWIYIRHWDKIREILEDYGTAQRYFPRYALSRFCELMQIGKYHLIISTERDLKLDTNNYWVIKHEIGEDDLSSLLPMDIPFNKVLSYIKKANLGQVIQILTYTQEYTGEEKVKSFIEASTHICGSNLDPEMTVTETVPEINLIGMDKILLEIEKAIIDPMQYSDLVPLKKGIVLAGPPGTGKTSIGRWLAYKLRGKLYLVDGSSGVSGNTLICNVTEALNKAYQNAPAVVFIDDVDDLFKHDDTYRSFLTLLDGLENKNRDGVCVIVTCMDITNIPSSLIRGGRLELVLQTSLPTFETCERILKLGFDRMYALLSRLEKQKRIVSVTDKLDQQLTSKFITDLSIQMCIWNCADIQRYLDDVLRSILNNKGSTFVSLQDISREIIGAIRGQYQLVKRPEDKIDYNSIYG